jgi:hypothetical protein
MEIFMKPSFLTNYPFAALFVAALSQTALGQNATPPPGYFDIPAGFDFPADKRLLEDYRSQPNMPAQRLHAWNVFAGMTRPTLNGELLVFETWFSEKETFQMSTAFTAARTQSSVRTFSVPRQFSPLRRRAGMAAPQPGSAALSTVLYNFAAYDHIRSNRLHIPSVLQDLVKNGAPDLKIPQNRTVPPFPASSIVLKTVWWPVAKDRVSAMPVWDPDANPAIPTGNPKEGWARFVGIDATRTSIPSGETADITYDGQVKRGSHIVGMLGSFHSIQLTAEMAAGVNSDGLLRKVAEDSFGRPVAAGDFAVLVATHLTTKEIDDWVWATFWWHDRPQEGPYAANRVGTLEGVWKNYLMDVAYDLNLPSERDGSPRVTFNPYLEARLQNDGHGGGVVSNCMNCHNRASTGADDFTPIYRGNPDFSGDTAYAPGSLRTDFLWSILMSHD